MCFDGLKPMLELKLFGHMELSGPGGRIDLANAKLSALLAYLALSGRRLSPRDELTDLLWGSHFEERAPFDEGPKFHAVVRRVRLVPRALSDDAIVAHIDDAPTTRSGVGFGGPVGKDPIERPCAVLREHFRDREILFT